jgi:hypothetical protein
VAERVHRIGLCGECDGLTVVDGSRFQATNVTLNGPDGPISSRGPATITIYPADPPACPNPEGARRG